MFCFSCCCFYGFFFFCLLFFTKFFNCLKFCECSTILLLCSILVSQDHLSMKNFVFIHHSVPSNDGDIIHLNPTQRLVARWSFSLHYRSSGASIYDTSLALHWVVGGRFPVQHSMSELAQFTDSESMDAILTASLAFCKNRTLITWDEYQEVISNLKCIAKPDTWSSILCDT